MTKTNKLIHYAKKTYHYYLFSQVFFVDLWKRPCVIVMLCNNLFLHKKILRARQLLFKEKIIWRELSYWNMYLLYDSWSMFIISMQDCLDNKNNSFIKWLKRKECNSFNIIHLRAIFLFQYHLPKRFIDLEWVK